MPDLQEGWWWPANSRKAHYLREGRSLCGRWGSLFGLTPGNLTPDDHTSPDDCVECRRRLEKEKARS